MAATSFEWITCPKCGSIFRVTVPAETQQLLVFSSYQPAYAGATYGKFGSDGPKPLEVDSGHDIAWRGGYLYGKRGEWDYVKTACPKPGCGQALWVVCILVSK